MELLQFLKSHEESRKIFGERELKIVEKQLWGVRLTQSEKNRLSRDIRKKFAFIKDVSKFIDEFSLKKGVEVKKLIEEAKYVILQSTYFPHIAQIILFGSSADNQRSLRSDIDIAVKFDKINGKNASEFRINVLGRVSEKTDVQVYNILPEKIKKEIDEKGKVIYERKNKR